MTIKDRNEVEENERPSDTGPQDLKHDNGKWYASKLLGLATAIVVGACVICYTIGYRHGKNEAMTGDRRTEEVATAPQKPDERGHGLSLSDCGTGSCRTIGLPQGEQLMSVTWRDPPFAPAVLTRPMPALATPMSYVLHVPNAFDRQDVTYRIVESGARPSADTPH